MSSDSLPAAPMWGSDAHLASDNTLVVHFVGLPTHLLPEVLHQELMDDAHIKAEKALTEYLSAIYLDGNFHEIPITRDTEPHAADAPKPLLSDVTCTLLWEEEAAAKEAAEDEPPDFPPLPPWRDKRFPLLTWLDELQKLPFRALVYHASEISL
ncbi:hypothetical protein L0F63_000906, partial [Massospora cicadina]